MWTVVVRNWLPQSSHTAQMCGIHRTPEPGLSRSALKLNVKDPVYGSINTVLNFIIGDIRMFEAGNFEEVKCHKFTIFVSYTFNGSILSSDSWIKYVFYLFYRVILLL